MKHNKIIIGLVLILFFMSFTAEASGRGGNGGDVVMCYSDSQFIAKLPYSAGESLLQMRENSRMLGN